ncbi:MAG: hypothetical protein ABSA52_25395 [Candidatus Binatia bacterium]
MAWHITFEWMALSLHLVDRIAGSTLDPERRSQFMQELVTEVSQNLARTTLTDQSTSNRQNFEDYFASIYQERSQFYTPLPLAIGPAAGTLFSEAANGIANVCFPNHPAGALWTHTLSAYDFPRLYAQLNLLRPAFTAAGSPQ